jgi:hypothetical protein
MNGVNEVCRIVVPEHGMDIGLLAAMLDKVRLECLIKSRPPIRAHIEDQCIVLEEEA